MFNSAAGNHRLESGSAASIYDPLAWCDPPVAPRSALLEYRVDSRPQLGKNLLGLRRELVTRLEFP
ncbi:MAG: hypothetical protein M3468_07800 [Acidobacteriota bacterium]|nr:hypothetical protein [Acidobacteriota bacterium]